jgi:hypothetical protein
MFRLDIPAKEELLIVMTHNSNDSFIRLCKNYIPDNVELLNLVELSRYKCDGEIMLNSLLARLNDKMKESAPYKLITFVIDFNSGYSGYNISPIENFIATLETEGTLSEVFNLLNIGEGDATPVFDYAFVKNQLELSSASLKENRIPFRIITTGGGGESIQAYYNNLVSITSEEARQVYNYNEWSYNRFIGSFRSVDASPVSVNSTSMDSPGAGNRRLSKAPPSSPAVSPASNYRRLPMLTKPSSRNNSSSSSTSSNGSVGSMNSPTATESPFSPGAGEYLERAVSECTSSQLRTHSVGANMQLISMEIGISNMVPRTTSNLSFFGDSSFQLPEQRELISTDSRTRFAATQPLSTAAEAVTENSAPEFKR